MKILKCRLPSGETTAARLAGEQVQPILLPDGRRPTIAELLEVSDPLHRIEILTTGTASVPLADVELLPPVDHQEIWAAGVTYKRSRTARMEESESSASCYDRVYAAPRPELFFKAAAHRVSGCDQALRIRADSQWNVPEPELALVLNSRLELAGFTIGNDMSSRDIEGENPLYLPQAKVYNQCCGLGPWITLRMGMPKRNEIGIRLSILRRGEVVFEGSTGIDQMARSFEDLIQWLGRDNSFPNGAFLLTGTGVVPTSDFTLCPDDVVEITIDGIGTLRNSIVQG
jgi:2-dehydro-3-deoxy-D-arabinonate dehydratase